MMAEDTVPKIDINPNDWVEICRILRTYVPELEVWAFGSRAKWTAKPYSDLDLAILTDKPLSLEKAAELRSALDESTIPIKVDFVDWAATSESFRKIIEADKIVVLRPETGLSGWTFKRLIDCTVDGILSYGIVQPGHHDERGVPIVRVNNISTGELHVDEPLRVSPEVEANYQRTRLKGGEVLLTVVGTTGQSAIVPKELAGWNVARAIAVIRPKPSIGAKWIHICLQSKTVQQFLNERANTTVQKTLNLADIKEVLIPIPPPEVKEMIESIAAGLDGKIEMNRRMNTTMDEIAQALFQSWFVDFDPVRAKLDGRHFVSLDPAVAAKFPDSFQESEAGHIPSGWQLVPLEVLASIRGGKQLPTEECLSDGQFEVFGANGTMGFAQRSTHEGFVIAFGRVGAYCGSIHWSLDGAWINNNASAVVPFQWPAFVLQAMLNVDFESMRTGSAQPFIPNNTLASTRVISPSRDVAEAFCRVVGPLRRQKADNDKQIRALTSLRDTLLPKLLSGELSRSVP